MAATEEVRPRSTNGDFDDLCEGPGECQTEDQTQSSCRLSAWLRCGVGQEHTIVKVPPRAHGDEIDDRHDTERGDDSNEEQGEVLHFVSSCLATRASVLTGIRSCTA